MNRAFLICAMALFLSGCFSDQKQKTVQCTLGAQTAFPGDNLSIRQDRYIKTCMDGWGYQFDMKSKKCEGGMEATSHPYCYSPEGGLENFIFQIESRLP